MQYITQCPHYSSVITTPFRKDNYLLSQIVKEQPIMLPKKHQSASRDDAMLIADSSISIQSIGGSGWIRTIDPRLIKTVL